MSKLIRLATPCLLVVGTLAMASTAGDEVTLAPLKYDAFLAKVAANKKAKLTVVDAWATWCAPCKENFPHLVEMHRKYADKGLAVISLSLDDPEKPKKLDEARVFLKKMNAAFPNYYLDESVDDAFDKLKIASIPAVFLFGPDGKEVQRFSLEDPNHPFTYDEVEKAIADRLGVSK